MRCFISFLLPFLAFVNISAQVNLPSTEQVHFDWSEMYKRINPSIVQIISDRGHGSGFVVSLNGVIATNHHVVANSRYLAVKLSDGRKVDAVLAVLDPRYDIALLKVNEQVIEGLEPLTILPDGEDERIEPGQPVVAFGSPLTQSFMITQGIVAKVEENILLGDFLLEQGNSGGPLLNIEGQVIGINTFGLRGISGAVRIHLLRELLSRSGIFDSLPYEPSSELLPQLKHDRYPTELLKGKIMQEGVDEEIYQFKAKSFNVTVITPVLVGISQVRNELERAKNRYERRGKKITDSSYQAIDEPFYDWHRNVSGNLDCAVTFQIAPEFGATTGSAFRTLLVAFANPNMVQNVSQDMEFKAEFLDFRLYRDGEFIEPIHPGRQVTEQNLKEFRLTFVDEAYSGLYVYDPEVFMGGEQFRMEIYDARKPDEIHESKTFDADSDLIKQIRSDFDGVIGESYILRDLLNAAALGKKEEVEICLNNEIDINSKNEEGHTALMLAASMGRNDTVDFLIDSGADLNLASNNGWTALLWAASRGHLMVVKKLVESGADIDATTPNGWTALEWAQHGKFRDVSDYLKQQNKAYE